MYAYRYQIFASLSATVSEISDGMQYGWSAPITALLLSARSPFPFKESDVVWVEISLLFGTLIGIPITVVLLESLGRKTSILVATAQNLLAWVLIAFANSAGVVYAARFLSGIAASVVFAAAPVYTAEIADKKIRGFLGSFFSLMMIGGILLVYSIAPFIPVVWSSAVGALFLVTQLVTFPFLPESPYYYLIKGQKQQARQALQKLRARCDVESELEEIAEAVDKQEAERGSRMDLFTVKSNRRALLILVVLNCAQHLAGISVLLMNIHTILSEASSDLSPSTAAILFSLVMWLAALFGSRCLDRFGRRLVLMVSCIVTGTTLLTLAIYFTVQDLDVDISSYSWIPVILVLIYAAAFRFGMGLVPIVLTAEIFPTSVKEIGVTIAEASFTASSCLAVFVYPYLTKTCGLKAPFYIFSICSFLTSVFVLFFVPETKGKTLEEIQNLLKGSRNDRKLVTSYGTINSANGINQERQWS
ncbi:hypothetical protein PPYR_12186 [Photinus pyralis]|uniref:Major facilitator superfamily (MFS) profile domain-containing protein n=2 Tax=Photinus pyralis TaxID=7054 RepID=A0A1Y1N388_PHOPY|nr:facilitated trehalose transporter Tret1-like [Photinus pyralis]KAB0795347.1 hypothetical protein PPYR_12186 [Photinus pyralis]